VDAIGQAAPSREPRKPLIRELVEGLVNAGLDEVDLETANLRLHLRR